MNAVAHRPTYQKSTNGRTDWKGRREGQKEGWRDRGTREGMREGGEVRRVKGKEMGVNGFID